MPIDLNRIKNFAGTRSGTVLLFVLWTLFVTDLWLPRNWSFYGTDDWDLTYATFESARKTIVDYHQWPGFNPYLAFGSDMDANPQSVHASLFFLPVLIFGTFYGYKVSIIFAIILGLFGMKNLLERLQVDTIHSILISMIFCSATYFSRHIMEAGHSNFLNFYLIPYLFLFLLKYKSDSNPLSGISVIIILTQFISSGAPLVFIISTFMIIAWNIGLLIVDKKYFSFTLQCIALIVLGFAVSLWKIIPVLEFWSQNPRIVIDDSGINPLIFLDALSDFKTDTGTPHGWHEFSTGIGLLIPVLILIYRNHIPHYKIAFSITLLFVWLTLGNIPSYVNPWYVIHHFVPIFDGLRAPSRFVFIVLFLLVLGFAYICKYEQGNKLIFIILISITLSNTLSYNSISRNIVFSKRLENIPANSKAVPQVTRSFKKDLFFGVRSNYLIVDAYEPQALPPVQDTLEEICNGARIIRFTPNKIDLQMNDSVARINLRYNSNWTAENAVISNENGIIKISTNQKDIKLVYSNPDLKRGLIAAFVSLIVAVSVLLYMKGRHKLNVR